MALILRRGFVLAVCLAACTSQKPAAPVAPPPPGPTPANVTILNQGATFRDSDGDLSISVTVRNAGDLPAYAVELYYTVECRNPLSGLGGTSNGATAVGQVDPKQSKTVEFKYSLCSSWVGNQCARACAITSVLRVRWVN